MPKNLLCFCLFCLCLFSFTFNSLKSQEIPRKPLTINIIFVDNGQGLEADYKVLKMALENLGHTVNSVATKMRKRVEADINISIEFIIPDKLAWAPINWFIPNPEWYRQNLALLDSFDLILCRTKEVERIFQDLNKLTYFLSFTSLDCYQEEVKKDYGLCVHLSGGSKQKGTSAIIQAWENNPQFPPLIVTTFLRSTLLRICPQVTWIVHRLPLEDFRFLQNHRGIHLCLSETEGFGHYLMEAMSTAAVVVTTDAPPMNEFITDPRCLVPFSDSSVQRLGINYYANSSLLEEKMEALMRLSPTELHEIGLSNRQNYLKIRREFHTHLEKLLEAFHNP